MDSPRASRDDPHVYPKSQRGFRCPICTSGAFTVLGKTRLGAPIYSCASCTAVFADPARFTEAAPAVPPAPRKRA